MSWPHVGILVCIPVPKRPTGYQLRADLIAWYPGTGERRVPDPIRSNQTDEITRTSKRRRRNGEEACRLEAREPPCRSSRPNARSAKKSSARLGFPFCTARPRWSWASTSRVSMSSACATSRRPPPTMRSVWACWPVRSPTVALTYCATGNAHDAYYFRRSQDMVAGAVAPPRLELGNQDLVHAHAHSIWLVKCGLDLKSSTTSAGDRPGPGQPRAEVLTTIESPSSRSTAITAITDVLTATTEVTSAPWWTQTWIADTVDQAPTLSNHYKRTGGVGSTTEAQTELDQANTTLKTIGASEGSKQRARGRISEARAALDLLKDRSTTFFR